MKCPVCKDIDLLMTEKLGVTIDYCPNCRGIWLDRNELEKIIEKSTEEISNQSKDNENSQYNEKNLTNKDINYSNKNYKKKKKESIFSQIFEMFGDE